MASVFLVEKMTCNGCVRHVTKAIQTAQVAADVKIDLATGKVEVTPDPADPAALAKIITEAGYPARHVS